MEGKEFFPLFISSSQKNVLVVGGGHIAQRRIKALAKFNFKITVVSKEITAKLKELCLYSNIKYINTEYKEEYISNCFMVLACTNDDDCNKRIINDCKSVNILANSCSDRTVCDFYFPSVIINDSTTVGIIGTGNNHKKTKETSDKIKEVLGED